MNELIALLQNTKKPRIAVVGDIMLDRYIWGDAERISQEAPVILLRAEQREERLGGAGSVATMLSALDAEPLLIGVIGDDRGGEQVLENLQKHKIDCTMVVRDSSRTTTTKERYIGKAQTRHPQQIIRVDYEDRHPIHHVIENNFIDFIAKSIDKLDAILISDYNKGVCTPRLLQEIIKIANRIQCPVIADPARGVCYAKYSGCTALTPNRLEAGLAVNKYISSISDALEAAAELQKCYNIDIGIVTLDKDGIVMADRYGRQQHFPTRQRQVYDITGAGDMVLASLGLALSYNTSIEAAIRFANAAGGLEVERIGVTPITRADILADILNTTNAHCNTLTSKLVTIDSLLSLLKLRRSLGQRIGFTNGCFDILHVGHVQYITEARQQVDCLIVGLNDDDSVRRLKGVNRPINDVMSRATVLAALYGVDYITVFSETTPLKLIETIKPDVLIKGGDYTKDKIVGSELVESYGGKVYIANYYTGFSTTRLLEQLKAA